MSRVQTRIVLDRPLLYFAQPFMQYREMLFALAPRTNEVTKLTDMSFDFCDVLTIQVRQSVFTYINAKDPLWLEYTCLQPGHISHERRTPTDLMRMSPALANYKDKVIFFSGGLNGFKSPIAVREEDAKKVQFYSVAKDIWREAPNMIVGRSYHSSCCLGDKVYVFAGSNCATHVPINSIESLDVKAMRKN